MAHRQRPVQPVLDRNDFKGNLNDDLMRAPSGVVASLHKMQHDPTSALRQTARRTPQHGPKGLHSISAGTNPLPRTHDMILSITSDPNIAPEDQPDSRFPPADNDFRIVGKRENLRFNRTVPSKFVTGALRASMKSLHDEPIMEETIRLGEMYPRTMTNRGEAPRLLPPDATFSLLQQSLPHGMLKEDRCVSHNMQECIKHEIDPETSREVRHEKKRQSMEAYTVKGFASYEDGKHGMRSLINKSRLGNGNPVTWKTPRFSVGQVRVDPIPIPEENLRLRTAGPARRRPIDPNKPPQTVIISTNCLRASLQNINLARTKFQGPGYFALDTRSNANLEKIAAGFLWR